MCKENARNFSCKSHRYQDRLRIFAGRKAIQQANDRRIHHSSDWCQLHLIILGELGPHDGGVVWVEEPWSGMCPIGDVSGRKSMGQTYKLADYPSGYRTREGEVVGKGKGVDEGGNSIFE